MRVSIEPNKRDMQEIRKTLKQLERGFGPSEMKKVMGGLADVMERDVVHNFQKDVTFDGQKMPALKPATIEYKKKIGKERKLWIAGLLQKITKYADANKAMVYSPAPYATALNDRQKLGRPFKFMGFGKRLLNNIDKELKYWLDKLVK